MKKIIVYMFAIVSLACAGMAFLAEPVSAANVGGVSVYSACKAQYGGGATARFTDFGNPFSWYCNK